MTRTIFQKITSSLWVLISFIPFFNGLGFVYIGNKYANAQWFAEGILYELPLILGLLTLPNLTVSTPMFIFGTLASMVSIVRSFMVDYYLQKDLDQSNIVETSLDEKIDSIINSLWVLISFIPLFNGLGLVYKGKTAPNKTWYLEGILYEIPWIIGILGIGFSQVRFVAFEAAVLFYFVSIFRSIMVATEPEPLYKYRKAISEEIKSNIKSNDVKEVKIEEETISENSEGVISVFKFYEKQFNELERIYPKKEKNTMELIEKRFAPPQLTYSRFKRVVDDSHETFYSQLNAGYSILELSTEYSTKVEDELKNKLIVLNSIIKGLDKLAEELVLNISQVDTESDDEIDNLFDEFKRATRSVSAYE